MIVAALLSILTLLVIPMLINKSTEGRGDWVKRYLREAWFCVAVIYLMTIALLPDGRDFIVRNKPAFAVSHPAWSYIIVATGAAALAVAYWFILGKLAPSPDQDAATKESGHVEIYFGTAAAVRGDEVSYKTEEEKKLLLTKPSNGGHQTLIVQPFWSNQFLFRVPIYIRNISSVPITHVHVVVSSNRIMNPVSLNTRIIKETEFQYDFGELRPFRQTGNETNLLIEIPTKSSPMTDPAILLVTVTGDGLTTPYNEMIQYGFTPL